MTTEVLKEDGRDPGNSKGTELPQRAEDRLLGYPESHRMVLEWVWMCGKVCFEPFEISF